MLIDIGTNRVGLVATIAAARGGRTVALRLPGGGNLIDPGETNWAVEGGSEVRVDREWSQDFGQVVWLGPQSRFWADQTAIPGRPVELEGWPPDPISVDGPYEVQHRAAGKLVLRGPASPVWQVELTKIWEALPDGAIGFSAVARNISDKAIRKGLWFNFRAPPEAEVRIPVCESGNHRIVGAADMRPAFGEGWLELGVPRLPSGTQSVDAKAFVCPAIGLIRIKASGGWLELSFPPTAPHAVAEGHAPVEIYRKVVFNERGILEVEQHAPCVWLGPGETMSHEEVWRWAPSAPETGGRIPEGSANGRDDVPIDHGL